MTRCVYAILNVFISRISIIREFNGSNQKNINDYLSNLKGQLGLQMKFIENYENILI